jgi:hypothetical protein
MEPYHLYIVNNKQSILLASSNSKKDLKEKALKMERFKKNLEKYNNLYLYRITINKVPEKDLQKQEGSTIKFIGGPYVANIERIQIKYNKETDDLKLVNFDKANPTGRVYFTEEYIKKNKGIKQDIIDRIAYDYVKKDYYNDSLFAINTTDMFDKKRDKKYD